MREHQLPEGLAVRLRELLADLDRFAREDADSSVDVARGRAQGYGLAADWLRSVLGWEGEA